MSRDLDRERQFISGAPSSDPDWLAAVADRLSAGQCLYGDRWTKLALIDLLHEIDEEALDIAAWSALAVQAIDRGDLAERDRRRVLHILERATHEAARIHDRLVTARRIADPARALKDQV